MVWWCNDGTHKKTESSVAKEMNKIKAPKRINAGAADDEADVIADVMGYFVQFRTRCVDGSASGATCFGMMELRVAHEPKPSQTLGYAPFISVLHGKPRGACNDG